jgi:diketogulonate reductase-like aldo/keto reductase
MEKVKASGKTKSIGISNFLRHHIETILDGATVVPAVNQIEFHPYLQRANNFLPWMREKGIAVSCFKGLAPLTIAKGGPLDSVIEKIAKTHDVPQAAVLLKWHLSQDVIAITTTSKEERLLEYLKAISLMLSAEELDEITKIGLTHHFRQQGAQRFAPDDRS